MRLPDEETAQFKQDLERAIEALEMVTASLEDDDPLLVNIEYALAGLWPRFEGKSPTLENEITAV